MRALSWRSTRARAKRRFIRFVHRHLDKIKPQLSAPAALANLEVFASAFVNTLNERLRMLFPNGVTWA